MTDSDLLDFLQREVEENGALLLHDGYANCGMNRGLAFSTGNGLLKRTLREAVRGMMPKASGAGRKAK